MVLLSWMAIKVVLCLVGYAWNDHDHGCRDRDYIALTILILMIWIMMRMMRIKITIRDKVEDMKIWLHLHGGPSKEKRSTLSVCQLLGTVPRTSDKTNTTSNDSNAYCTPSVYYAVQKQLLYESLTPWTKPRGHTTICKMILHSRLPTQQFYAFDSSWSSSHQGP